MMLAFNTAAEPTRSVLLRSAASLAIDCGEQRDAERLIALKTFAFTGGDHGKTARILGVEEKHLRGQLTTWLGGNGHAPDRKASGARVAGDAADAAKATVKKAAGKSTRSAPAARKAAKQPAKSKSKTKSRR